MTDLRDRDRVIIAATKRGLNTFKVATALGISHQAVSQRLEILGLATVRKSKGGHPNRRKPRVPRKCKFCGKPLWQIEQRKQRYCSYACANTRTRRIFEPQVVAAIDMRTEQGLPWKDIATTFRISPQCMQQAIWRYLAKQDRLFTSVVELIWRPRGHGRWGWLERHTGLSLNPGEPPDERTSPEVRGPYRSP